MTKKPVLPAAAAKRGATLGRLRAEIIQLQAEAIDGADDKQAQIASERITNLELAIKRHLKWLEGRSRRGVPAPKSYLDAVKEKRAKARAISGRARIRARFVQGGAPGSGKQ